MCDVGWTASIGQFYPLQNGLGRHANIVGLPGLHGDEAAGPKASHWRISSCAIKLIHFPYIARQICTMSVETKGELQGIQEAARAVAITLSKMRNYARPGMSAQELDEYGYQLLQYWTQTTRKPGGDPLFSGPPEYKPLPEEFRHRCRDFYFNRREIRLRNRRRLDDEGRGRQLRCSA